ncbi:hypothetical protein IB211_00539 [Intestinimonas butyriciproducens]|uniref:Uncharacterized protein n=1 Tax=Intestinimonas butyriciproducens TaxID=1297617 RepID=A0A0S2W0N5_9FIRM|nr:hypothetical protein IB211_00539 [Intestinimonas butyriciproducens]QBB64861.1 hypothetical protein SRB521_00597 [Intestinimonas butyriciproducens]
MRHEHWPLSSLFRFQSKYYITIEGGAQGGSGVEKDARKGAGPGIFLDRPRKEAYTKI